MSSKYESHGDTWKGGATRLYWAWANMRHRCRTGKPESYKHVTCCPEWASYIAFKQWARSNGYRKTLYLDRKDNLLGYTPDNCRWVTLRVSSQNVRWTAKRAEHIAEVQRKRRIPVACTDTGERFDSAADAERRYGLTSGCVTGAVRHGWKAGGFRWAYWRANDESKKRCDGRS